MTAKGIGKKKKKKKKAGVALYSHRVQDALVTAGTLPIY